MSRIDVPSVLKRYSFMVITSNVFELKTNTSTLFYSIKICSTEQKIDHIRFDYFDNVLPKTHYKIYLKSINRILFSSLY